MASLISLAVWGMLIQPASGPATEPVFDRPSEPMTPQSHLLNTRVFASSAIGNGGRVSLQVLSLRSIAAENSPGFWFRTLAGNGNVCGKLYALIGLRRFDRDAYVTVLKDMRSQPDLMVQTFFGCIYAERPLSVLLDELDRGEYDGWLESPTTRPADR